MSGGFVLYPWAKIFLSESNDFPSPFPFSVRWHSRSLPPRCMSSPFLTVSLVSLQFMSFTRLHHFFLFIKHFVPSNSATNLSFEKTNKRERFKKKKRCCLYQRTLSAPPLSIVKADGRKKTYSSRSYIIPCTFLYCFIQSFSFRALFSVTDSIASPPFPFFFFFFKTNF